MFCILVTASVKSEAEIEPELLVSKAEKMFDASLDVPPLSVTKLDNSSAETVPSLLVSNRLTNWLPTLLDVLDEVEDEDVSSDGGGPCGPPCFPPGGGGGIALAS